MPDETVYRCMSASCARSLPRRVNFCPYCGTAQHAGAAGAAAPPAVELRKGGAAVPPAAAPGAAGTVAPPAPGWGAASHAGAAAPAASRAATAGAAAATGNVGAAAAPPPPAAAPARASVPVPARPPERAPVRLRWWLLALAALWLVWIKEKPSTSRVDARIDRAISLATDCKAREAQSELIALRSAGAREEQLLHVQQALNEAAAACSRSRRKGRAWRGAEAESPVATSPAGRLLADFIRRWDR